MRNPIFEPYAQNQTAKNSTEYECWLLCVSYFNEGSKGRTFSVQA